MENKGTLSGPPPRRGGRLLLLFVLFRLLRGRGSGCLRLLVFRLFGCRCRCRRGGGVVLLLGEAPRRSILNLVTNAQADEAEAGRRKGDSNDLVHRFPVCGPVRGRLNIIFFVLLFLKSFIIPC